LWAWKIMIFFFKIYQNFTLKTAGQIIWLYASFRSINFVL
jgi:hypothetical protein